MQGTFQELRDKEVISVSDGCRFGYVCDLDLELASGQVMALVIPGKPRFFGLFGAKDLIIVPWKDICRIGPDIILVEGKPLRRPVKKREKRRRW
ncbi:MAG: YlmC/YmxH family sporulation protein [Oscillospiraceae bacterium]|nr:YlmC/YmxH family sporulation protein [Oscillospiraceae bacterium]